MSYFFYVLVFLYIFLLKLYTDVDNLLKKYDKNDDDKIDEIAEKENKRRDDFVFIKLNKSYGEKKCGKAMYLSEHNVYTDCNLLCKKYTDYNSNLDEKMYSYEYQYFRENHNSLYLNKGAYCVLKSVIHCNPSIHDIVFKEDHGTMCISKYPEIFGGENDNEILVCDGNLKDLKTNSVYRKTFPYDVKFKHLDEMIKLSDGTRDYRFQCESNKDYNGNLLIERPDSTSRFDLITNVCASTFPKSVTIVPDWSNNTCVCDKAYTEFNGNVITNMFDNVHLPCTTCSSDYQIDINESPGHKYGFVISRPCIDENTPYHLWKIIKMPCSPNTMEQDVNARKKCERGIMLASNVYSPLALENMYNG